MSGFRIWRLKFESRLTPAILPRVEDIQEGTTLHVLMRNKTRKADHDETRNQKLMKLEL